MSALDALGFALAALASVLVVVGVAVLATVWLVTHRNSN